MLPRLQFGGPAAQEAFVAEGSRWVGETWVRLAHVEEDFVPLLESALQIAKADFSSRILVTFDFPDLRDGVAGFDAKLWSPESIRPVDSALSERTRSFAIKNHGVEPNDDQLLQSIANLRPIFDDDVLSKVVLAQRLRLDAPANWNGLKESSGPIWNLSLKEANRAFYGQSPEALLRWQNGRLETMALAGTTSRSDDPADDARMATSLLESQKDRLEHQSVVTHLRQIFSAHCNWLCDSEPPQVIKLPQLQHLCTHIHATDPDIHPLIMAAKLHPTPALCGTPRLEALRHLHQVEGFPRGLYGGVIGWFTPSSGSLVVGLRAIQQQDDVLEVIAGAGCVSGSDPHRELEEIQLKRDSILAEAGLYFA